MRTMLGFLLLATAPVTAAHGAEADIFTGAGQESSLDCDGGALEVQGASNTLDITGNCSALRIEGAGNRIHVTLADAARLVVIGADNQVIWTTPSGKKPRMSITGAANRIAPAR